MKYTLLLLELLLLILLLFTLLKSSRFWTTVRISNIAHSTFKFVLRKFNLLLSTLLEERHYIMVSKRKIHP